MLNPEPLDGYLDALQQDMNALRVLFSSEIFELFSFDVKRHKKVVFIAVGKSYLASVVSVKIANSYGLKWYALNAQEALHGDLGIVNDSDLVVLVSKSGETKELIDVFDLIPHNTAVVLTFSDNFENSLQKERVLYRFNLPICSEASIFEHPPISSTILIQLFINTLVQKVVDGAFMEDYAKNHAAGAIGARIEERSI
ncbi:MAG: SIS domain-containing protein [Gammaproteobacteria bacterium]